MVEKGKIIGINGPVVKVRGNDQLSMLEMLLVGHDRLIAEVIGVQGEDTIVQVYESTTGLKVNEPVYASGKPLSLKLGPGIIGGVFDGIQRPLEAIQDQSGAFINRGLTIEPLNLEKQWNTHIMTQVGEKVSGGSILAEVDETELIKHKIMVPPHVEGTVTQVVADGRYQVNDTIVTIKTKKNEEIRLTLVQEWPVRQARPFKQRRLLSQPLITGQRVIDTFFPIAKGGAASIPGGFGTGKTMTQHQLAKWSDADIIVYIGCGERGNEITEVLEDFPKLIDPTTDKPLMDRTILIANTSNMPVAAREASIYTGITLAEYYRDMGYHVAIMADSTSRWAEALREISGRLEEMPAEEGFPAYLPSRLAQFYERAGYVLNLNDSEGSVSIIGAVSPQGGDFSEPVTQNTKRFVRCFWGLDKELAYSRHYPAIQWLNSYSEYIDDLKTWYSQEIDEDFFELRTYMMRLLQEESKLMEIVKLIGADVLPEGQKLSLEIAKVIRIAFLQQNAFHAIDTYVPLIKQYHMMTIIKELHTKCQALIKLNIPVSEFRNTGIFEEVYKMKYQFDNEDMAAFDTLKDKIKSVYESVIDSYKQFERKKSQ